MSTNIRDKAIISLASVLVSLSVFSQSTDQNYLMETTMLDANSANVIRSVQTDQRGAEQRVGAPDHFSRIIFCSLKRSSYICKQINKPSIII